MFRRIPPNGAAPRRTESPNPSRPSRRTRVARAAKVGLAVGVTLVAAPFDARADETPATWQWWIDGSDAPALSQRAPGDPLLDACPIDGSSTFEDSWGWSRSGGRRHQGVDLIAERGTPIVAVRDGYAQFKNSGLGGRAVWLTTDDGDKFYYAHLDAWEGENRDVVAGELIGYVGSSGNAKGPHLHFETLPGGATENPFPHTLGACVPPPEPVVNEVAAQHASSAIASRRAVEGPSSAATEALRSVVTSAEQRV